MDSNCLASELQPYCLQKLIVTHLETVTLAKAVIFTEPKLERLKFDPRLKIYEGDVFLN